MNVFTKKNALVGFLTLKALSRSLERRRSRRRSGLRIAGFVALGLVSVGILAGVAAVMLRRRGESEDDAQGEPVAVADDDIVGEVVTSAAASLPMCSYPDYPHYVDGSPAEAASYRCAAPAGAGGGR